MAARDKHGHWLAGHGSANPGGRSGSLKAVRALLEPHVEEYVTALVALFDNPDAYVRLAALKEYGDRLLGKPLQSAEIESTNINMSLQEMWLNVVREGNAARPAPAIEHEPDAAKLRGPGGK